MNKVGAFAKKCECCRNIWNIDDSSFNVCTPCLQDSKGYQGIDIENLDNTVDFKQDFYLWSNGGWLKRNPLSDHPEYPSWNTFTALFDLNLGRLRDILTELQSSDKVCTAEDMKLADFYNSFIDEETIESRKLEPILPYIKLAHGTSSTNLLETISRLHGEGICNPFFGLYPSPDKKNSDITIPTIVQGGLGLPDRDYYFDADKEDKRSYYLEFITAIFNYIGEDTDLYQDKEQNAKIAQAIFEYEKLLAASHLTKTECRDPQLTYNLMSLKELNELTKPKIMSYAQYLARGQPDDGLDYVKFFNLFGSYFDKSADEFGNVNVSQVEYMKKLSSQLSDASPVLSHYLVFHVVLNNCNHLTKKYVDLKWLLFENRLSGTVEQKPRWKRGLAVLESALGEALGKIYVQKYFNEESKAKALRIVNLVLTELKQRLNEVEWMMAPTKEEALLKMNKFRVKIGYPDKFQDYSKLEVRSGFHLENVFSSRKFDQGLDVARMNAPTDREKWEMTPQTINAYYHPNLNEIVFPAAILQSPFFDPLADDAVNFGSMGAVIGHEMTHGFDDKGLKFDSKGIMRNWWQETDEVEYEKRASVMIAQAEKFEVYGIKLNGKLTNGENIADLGGLRLSYRALCKSLPENPPLINGFSPQQRFFIAWSQCWRENIKEERAKQLVTLDPHGPNDMRANSPLQNLHEFYEAFGVGPEDKMYRPEQERVLIW